MAGVGSRAPVLAPLPPGGGRRWNDDILRLGASVAYYTLFAIAPILLIATALAYTEWTTGRRPWPTALGRAS